MSDKSSKATGYIFVQCGVTQFNIVLVFNIVFHLPLMQIFAAHLQ